MKNLIAVILTFSLTVPAFAAKYKLPRNYEKLGACEKQKALWEHVEKTEHRRLPKFEKMGIFKLIAMSVQAMRKKKNHSSDVAPKRWKKHLHRRGSVAKVKIVPTGSHAYTGAFQGAPCALVRLSLTYRPSKKRDVAPGLALKILRDDMRSANVSALYRLEGQKKDYNFFANPLSNIVPIGTEIGLKLVHAIFRRVTDYPEELLVDEFATYTSTGKKESAPKGPRQIFFVPNPALKMKSSEHDVRKDFHTIKEGTVLYSIHAVDDKHKDFNYFDYDKEHIGKFLKDSTKIADIVTTSKFVSSEFGDTGIFFRHEMRPEYKKSK